jgi:hypothetical protein
MMPRGKDWWTDRSVRIATLPAVGLAAAVLGAAVLRVSPLAAQTQPETVTFESKQYRYTVTLPAGCRREVGPGTVDAVCAPDFAPQKSAVANAAGALVLGVAAESIEGSGDTGIAGLRQRYTEAGFKEELPEAICGEQDRGRVKIENFSQSEEGNRLVYTADVVCAEIKFLQIGSRRAIVRHVIGPYAVYRLVARAPAEEFEKQRATIDAFFASFRLTAIENAEK